MTQIPLEKDKQPIPVFLPERSHRQRSLVGYSPWGCIESDTKEQLSMAQESHYWAHTLRKS